jgi:hypothetical protein
MERMREAAANYRAGLTHGQSAAELQEKRIAMLRLAEQNARQARESLAKQITEHSLAGKFDPRMKDEVESETEAYNKALERERALGAALARELGVLATQIADPTGMPILRGGRPGPTPNPSAGGGEAATAEPRADAAATSEPHAAGPSASQAEAAEAFKQANEKAAWLLTHTAAPANEVHRELAKEIQLIAERYGLAPSEGR